MVVFHTFMQTRLTALSKMTKLKLLCWTHHLSFWSFVVC